MATDLKTEQPTSVTALVSGIVQDAQELVKQQFALFKSELRADLHNVEVALQVLSIAAGVFLIGGVLIGGALALGLQAAVPELPLWAWTAIVGGVFFVFGAILLAAGLAKLRAVQTPLESSAEGLKENLQWKMNPK